MDRLSARLSIKVKQELEITCLQYSHRDLATNVSLKKKNLELSYRSPRKKSTHVSTPSKNHTIFPPINWIIVVSDLKKLSVHTDLKQKT